jgi:hypothetical protein
MPVEEAAEVMARVMPKMKDKPYIFDGING